MDITKFINSKDIADYWKTAFHPEDYEDLSLRYAWLIWQSRKTTIKEKHSAWQEIIDTMPDILIPSRVNMPPEKSLHKSLGEIIAAEQRLINMFMEKEGNYKYSYSFICDEDDYENGISDMSSLEECIDALNKDIRSEGDIKAIHICKEYFTGPVIDLTLSADGQDVLYIDALQTSDREYIILTGVFGNMWFDFPVPFKKGDILQGEFYIPSGNVFVLDSLSTAPARLEQFGDDISENDTATWGYFIDSKGIVRRDAVFSYMNLENYCPEETEKDNVLKAISNYIKGQITIDLLMNSYLMNYMKKQTRQMFNYPGFVLDMAGLL